MRKKLSLFLFLLILISCNDKTSKENHRTDSSPSYSENEPNKELTQTETKEINYSTNVDDEILKNDCSDTHSSGDEAYSNCRNAYNSEDFEEIKAYLKKAMNSFEEAMSNAEDCKCDEAHSDAEEGYNYAKKGYRSDDFGEIKRYAKKAKNSAEDVMSKADDCSN